MWHVVFAEGVSLPKSRAARSRDHAIQVACELLSQSVDVRRIIEPDGRSIERLELNEHFDGGRFPGLRKLTMLRGILEVDDPTELGVQRPSGVTFPAPSWS